MFGIFFQKMHYSRPERANTENVFSLLLEARFFLGFNRCAYGNSFAYTTMDGTTVYSGVVMFAVDETCTYAFLYNGVYDSWKRFKSAGNIEFPGSVRCGRNATRDFPEAKGRRDILLKAQDP